MIEIPSCCREQPLRGYKMRTVQHPAASRHDAASRRRGEGRDDCPGVLDLRFVAAKTSLMTET